MSDSGSGSAARIDVTDQQQLLEVSEDDVTSAALLALALENRGGHVEVALVDDATISELHGRYMGDPTPTDVITFPLDDDCAGAVPTEPGDGPSADSIASLGEIVVSTETAIRQAPEFGTDPVAETLLYVIHGVLHLLGYDDIEDRDRARMEVRQRQILVAWQAGQRATPGSP